ncbi:hypothetical protein OUZ56_024811 [Daphnia magna]|uniref:Uncharacterized protein n=1 Tax=Daphnia magna TaxID=35525 RepID=A0ABQ9ZI25_9CRUS|nr:hypothetical protein OUZ56_024811 [Daphnia magna]
MEFRKRFENSKAKQSIFTERQNKINSMIIQKEHCLDEQVYCICCSSDGPTTVVNAFLVIMKRQEDNVPLLLPGTTITTNSTSQFLKILCFYLRRLVRRLARRLVRRLARRLVHRLARRLVHRLARRIVHRLARRLFRRPAFASPVAQPSSRDPPSSLRPSPPRLRLVVAPSPPRSGSAVLPNGLYAMGGTVAQAVWLKVDRRGNAPVGTSPLSMWWWLPGKLGGIEPLTSGTLVKCFAAEPTIHIPTNVDYNLYSQKWHNGRVLVKESKCLRFDSQQ